jgi:hypothetical protein
VSVTTNEIPMVISHPSKLLGLRIYMLISSIPQSTAYAE